MGDIGGNPRDIVPQTTSIGLVLPRHRVQRGRVECVTKRVPSAGADSGLFHFHPPTAYAVG
jgi:hypothetical protein